MFKVFRTGKRYFLGKKARQMEQKVQSKLNKGESSKESSGRSDENEHRIFKTNLTDFHKSFELIPFYFKSS